MATIRLKYVNFFRNKHRKATRERYFFRRRGCKAIPLPGMPGSAEIRPPYAPPLAAGPGQKESGADPTNPGTVTPLAGDWSKAEDGVGVAVDTRKSRWVIIEGCRNLHGDKRVATVQRHNIENMLAAIQKPGARRHWLKAIRGLLHAAIPLMRRDNPTDGVRVKL